MAKDEAAGRSSSRARGGAALERPPRRVFSSPRRPALASSQPSLNFSHPFLLPSDLPHEAARIVPCAREVWPLVRAGKSLAGQEVPALALKRLPSL